MLEQSSFWGNEQKLEKTALEKWPFFSGKIPVMFTSSTARSVHTVNTVPSTAERRKQKEEKKEEKKSCQLKQGTPSSLSTHIHPKIIKAYPSEHEES